MANEGIEIGIFSHNDPSNKLDTLGFRRDPKYLDEIDDVGAGSFVIGNDDEQIRNDADLLQYRNLVRVYVENKCRGGFLIQKKEPVYLGKGEYSAKETEISGEGLKTWLHDATVHPEGGLKTTSPESRHFNFATARGDWYKPEQWKTPISFTTTKDMSSANPWKYAPAEWPDAPSAKWVWGHAREANNQQPIGDNYFRFEFNVASKGDYSVFFAADDAYDAYIDGELAQAEAGSPANWKQTTRIDKEGLEPGTHVFAIRVRNTGGGAGLVAAVFRVGNADTPVAASLVGQTGGAGWVVASYPDPVPGWSPGGVMITLLNEAKARDVRMAGWLTPTFTETKDSAGNDWERFLPWEFGVGTDYLSVLETLEELSCEAWIDPETLELHMWIQRGYERATQTTQGQPVAFREGLNLLKASESGKADIKNVLLLKSQDGWDTSQDQASSLDIYGRIEGKLEVDSSSSMAKLAASRTFELKASPEIGASYDIIPTTDIVPFQDFNVGDWVLAPGADGLVRRRIMSISVAESGENIQYNVEFDSIFRDRESKFEKWLEKIGGGSLGGDMASSGVPSLTPPPPNIPLPKDPSAPVGGSWSSEGDWNIDGAAFSRVTLTWGQVTTNTDGSPLEGVRYEVWGKREPAGSLQYLASLTGVTSRLQPFEPSSSWSFYVRAVSVQGIYSEYSAPITVLMAAPVKPLTAPTPPGLDQNLGVVIASWDGKLTGPPIENAPGHFKHLFAVVADTETGAYVPMGPSLFSAGDIPISGLSALSTVWVKFVAVDRLGVESPASAPAQITIADWSAGVMDEVDTALDALQEALDDLNAQLEDYVPKTSYGNGINVYRDVVNFYDSSSSNTGTLVIETNVPFTGPMIQVDFEGAQLTGGNLQGGFSMYAYATGGGTVYNPRYTTSGEQSVVVRFAKKISDNKLVVLIDTKDSTPWRYLRFSIPELRVGFSLPADLEKNWVTKITTDLTAYTAPSQADFARDFNDTHLLTESWRKTGTVKIDGGNIYADSITSAQIAANAITVNELAAGSVTTDKILVNTLDGDRILVNSLMGSKIVAESIIGDKIAANAITAEKIVAYSITTNHLAVGAVTTEILATRSVVSEHIQSGAITAEKIAVGAITADVVDAEFFNGQTFIGSYFEAPIIASSPLLGIGANMLVDPEFDSTLDTAWVSSGYTGDDAQTIRRQRRIRWDKTVSGYDSSKDKTVVSRHWGNLLAETTIQPVEREVGSVLRSYRSFLNTATTGDLVNPYSGYEFNSLFPTLYGGDSDPAAGWDVVPAPLTTAPVTTYLTNSGQFSIVSGEVWTLSLSHRGVSDVSFITDARVEIVSLSGATVYWSRSLTSAELSSSGKINATFTADFTATAKFRIRSTYLAAGSGFSHKGASGYSRQTYDGKETSASVLDVTGRNLGDDAGTGYDSIGGTHPVPGDFLYQTVGESATSSNATALRKRAAVSWTVYRASLGKVQPEKGFRLTREEGLELFNAAGARTGKLDGASNFLAGRFASAESGQRVELSNNSITWYDNASKAIASMGASDIAPGGWINSLVTSKANWTLVDAHFKSSLGKAYVWVRVKYVGSSSISVPASGNIANQVVASINYYTGMVPANNGNVLSSGHTGRLAAGYVEPNGEIMLSAVDGNGGNINSGEEFTLGGTYYL